MLKGKLKVAVPMPPPPGDDDDVDLPPDPDRLPEGDPPSREPPVGLRSRAGREQRAEQGEERAAIRAAS